MKVEDHHLYLVELIDCSVNRIDLPKYSGKEFVSRFSYVSLKRGRCFKSVPSPPVGIMDRTVGVDSDKSSMKIACRPVRNHVRVGNVGVVGTLLIFSAR